MKVTELYGRLCDQIPQSLSMPWDNDGLQLCPEPEKEVKRVLCALDLTPAAAQFAIDHRCDAVLTHHPLMFAPLSVLQLGSGKGDTVLRLAKAGISSMSFHTRYDALDGGMNDILCNTLGFKPGERFGEEGECIGRLADIPEIPVAQLAEHVKKTLGAPFVLLSAGCCGKVSRVALCAGDAKDFIIPAAKCGADVLICGRASYNTVIESQEHGIAVIEAGHYYTEVICVPDLAARVTAFGIEALQFTENDITAI